MLRFAPDCCDSSASLANPGNSALMSMDWLYGCSQVAPRSRENTKKDVKPWPLDVSTPTIHSGPCVKHYETLHSMKFLMCNQLWKHLGTGQIWPNRVVDLKFCGRPFRFRCHQLRVFWVSEADKIIYPDESKKKPCVSTLYLCSPKRQNAQHRPICLGTISPTTSNDINVHTCDLTAVKTWS